MCYTYATAVDLHPPFRNRLCPPTARHSALAQTPRARRQWFGGRCAAVRAWAVQDGARQRRRPASAARDRPAGLVVWLVGVADSESGREFGKQGNNEVVRRWWGRRPIRAQCGRRGEEEEQQHRRTRGCSAWFALGSRWRASAKSSASGCAPLLTFAWDAAWLFGYLRFAIHTPPPAETPPALELYLGAVVDLKQPPPCVAPSR